MAVSSTSLRLNKVINARSKRECAREREGEREREKEGLVVRMVVRVRRLIAS
eukprot:COSAG05_NODE_18765_length_303_cov_0.843137_2_plen_51_part_01